MKKLSLAMVAGVATLLFASAATAGSVRADGSARSAAMLKVCPDADKCFTSIQAAIDAATDGDRIKIAVGTYQGSLVIDKDIALDGAGAADTIITGEADRRVITTASGVSVLLKAVSVTGGHPHLTPVGGGILNRGSLELVDLIVAGNSAGGYGGGIYNVGTLSLKHSEVSDNVATGVEPFGESTAGGIFNLGDATLFGSTVRGNSAYYDGGIENRGTMTLRKSTVSDNSAGVFTGGIGNSGTLILYDSSVSSNSAGHNGGIGNGGELTLHNSLVNDNVARGFGGGAAGIANGGTLAMYDTAVTGNEAQTFGGGILNGGTLTMQGGTLADNTAQESVGGGLWNTNSARASASLSDATVTRNTAEHGGGIYNAGQLTLSETTVNGNTATCTGGGLYNVATVLLFASTISGNTPNDRVDAGPITPVPCVDGT